MGPRAPLSGAWQPTRRQCLAAGAALALPGLAGCEAPRAFDGGWVGASAERGHRLQAAASAAVPTGATRRVGVAVLGAGVSGLAAARALRLAGIDDLKVFELEDVAGGNARGHRIGAQACPLGAHYLPVPGEAAREVRDWLVEIGLAQRRAGRFEVDERHLCHSPQERLFIAGQWQDGLLPVVGIDARTQAQYQRFAAAIEHHLRSGAFRLPSVAAPWTPELAALDAISFAAWLDANGFDAPPLRWYLDYACRDDYGAGAARVSAWAGIHYFASRHGFHAPEPRSDAPPEHERDAVLTWPEGNAWLVDKLAAPLGERLVTGALVQRVREEHDGVVLDVWHAPVGQVDRWIAQRAVLALPLHVAARIVEQPPQALAAAAGAIEHAPWLVANLAFDRAPLDRIGAPLSWDNVVYGSASLGYVNAGHQSTAQAPRDGGPTVLTAYWALGADSAAAARSARTQLLQGDWRDWTRQLLAELAPAHPDLPAHLQRADLMRYGHAMSIPTPGLKGHAGLAALRAPQGRLHFAHADLAGYSVFEEAFTLGHRAGLAAARALRGQGPA